MVNIKIAIVPANAPKPKMKVAIKATTKVGNVRNTLKINLKTPATNRFLTILIEDNTAKGIANSEPIIDPSNDILIVSNNGPQTRFMYFQFGGIMSPIITKNCLLLKIKVLNEKFVTSAATNMKITVIKI